MVPAKIIVVDDNYLWLPYLQETLIIHGFRVDTAMSANMAFAKMQPRVYDLAIIDIRMPNPRGEMENDAGIKLCEKLYASGIRTPVIILTVRDDVELANRLKKLPNVIKVLSKDLKEEKFISEVKSGLEMNS